MIKKLFEKVRWHMLSENGRIQLLRKRGVKIGEGCSIAKNAEFGTEPYLISIGNNVRLTSNVKFVTHDGGMWVLRNLDLLPNADKFGTIKIGDNVHIGWDVTIMPGVSIGSNCVIGVGALVTKDIPDNSIAVGFPAKVIEGIEGYYLKNRDIIDATKMMSGKEKKTYLEKKYGHLNS